MIHREEMSVTMTRGWAWGPHVALGSPDRPTIYPNVTRKQWGSIEIGDKATVWFLWDMPIWVHWHPKTSRQDLLYFRHREEGKR